MQQNNEWALAPAGCFSRISRKFNPFSAACLAPAFFSDLQFRSL
jgi:hypothetical protein